MSSTRSVPIDPDGTCDLVLFEQLVLDDMKLWNVMTGAKFIYNDGEIREFAWVQDGEFVLHAPACQQKYGVKWDWAACPSPIAVVPPERIAIVRRKLEDLTESYPARLIAYQERMRRHELAMAEAARLAIERKEQARQAEEETNRRIVVARKEANREKKLDRHRRLLAGSGKVYQGVRKRSEAKPPRQATCFNCCSHLDSELDDECVACGWILCECGGCCCTYGTIRGRGEASGRNLDEGWNDRPGDEPTWQEG